ncbi:hypothetical protein MTsPCn9_32120 [Croceitalea sp. MTPC9]|uniref:hypothetical protein n=1 Tax=unclassified Croceitalea TaxID=2632280 RepID=UPI002B3F0736|nr:hypothetical protein MTsPCn6_32420 [Croceitalea sp. MTPC6]GMN18272.1 hypothetical protein MTsPCn9_32120 [Croceitalea sp. MTPC9]
MSRQGEFSNKMRIYHRYLGFFLAGIMGVYAISGIVLIFRKTDYLKVEVINEKQVAANLSAEELGKAIKIKGLNFTSKEGALAHFDKGSYNATTGEVSYMTKKLPLVLDKMTHMHKATTKDPLFFLNIFFGVALLFFVVSAFWMFLPGSTLFKKGLYFAAGGVVLTLLMLLI